MNKYMLMVIDHQLNPKKHTKKQLNKNADDAYEDYIATNDDETAAYAANAAFDVYDNDATNTDYWVNEYFMETGENKQDYIEAINKDNKQ